MKQKVGLLEGTFKNIKDNLCHVTNKLKTKMTPNKGDKADSISSINYNVATPPKSSKKKIKSKNSRDLQNVHLK